jgi:hypothetical protein
VVPPVFLAFRRISGIAAVALFSVATHATTFPLAIPTRPTTFPLSRPSLAGEVVAWGSNTFGQLTIPPGASNVIAIAAGFNHNLVLRSDGTVVAWGDNRYGQCDVPIDLTGVVSIAGGAFHSLALKNNGQVVAWGTNDSRIRVPQGLSDAVAVAANYYLSIALRRNGTIAYWGKPLEPIYDYWTNFVAISCDYTYAYGIDPQGVVVNFSGGTQFNNFSDFARLSSGFSQISAIRSDGTVAPPLSPLGLRPVDLAAIGAGSPYVAFATVLGDGSVRAWGINGAPPEATNPPPRLRAVVAIAGGQDHFLALRLPSPPIPTTARATAQVVNGFIVGLNITDGGEGYAIPPQVTITGGGGSGATATAQISNGIVTGFTITNAGIGYTSAPTVEFESPPFLPKLSIATSRVGVTMQVVPGKRYQLESSNDLPNFGPVGVPFIADKDTITQEFVVSETGQFFRIVEAP